MHAGTEVSPTVPVIPASWRRSCQEQAPSLGSAACFVFVAKQAMRRCQPRERTATHGLHRAHAGAALDVQPVQVAAAPGSMWNPSTGGA